ncbi:glycoside hydrolase family 3 N-terminal domain-containing protein [Bradyrhizobium sp. CER78]|uniref:glycoside hydrolase family 3 N-terminal domain-containing protein n=1 Tax=Bradyrhizobium sp. CER78 TaxID=3039162 RepID=UPI00244B9EC7|nr:glycoside hydrolase family 3 N-terminal domain-containing protein [Bradyrhizobium sp. CER78]MDH2382296.1 glycoside hydrolase family 3 N-terminal domain-containing protein [Bradyrhizobium sp. CER78]
MQVSKCIGIALLWIGGLVFVFAGINNNDPYLVPLRGTGNLLLVTASIAVVFMLVRRAGWRRRSWAGRLLVVLWCLPPLAVLAAHGVFEVRRHRVLQTDPVLARSLGQHFVVGYRSFDEVAPLVEKGFIAGIYVTRRNVAGRTADALKAEIAALQARRRAAGLPPLMVATDQEGGIVSHLAPPLTRLPALASLAELAPHEQRTKAEEFGRIHGRELASLGINLNFAPVLDLRPDAKQNQLDFNTLTNQRAISDDPAKVSAIAGAYVHGLESAGVGATVKHFPGLGRVRADTHHFSADLDTPVGELEATDWRPFRDVLSTSGARLMVGHVAVSALDPGRPASHSKAVVDGLIRKTWNYQGIVMTDDLVMGAIYQHDVCIAAVEALNAGVDLLLVAYDGLQFYRLFACATDAAARGGLDTTMLHDSETRLRHAQLID